MALACFGLANNTEAGGCRPPGAKCTQNHQCCSGNCYFSPIPLPPNPAGPDGLCF
jgi:hypothetical protein